MSPNPQPAPPEHDPDLASQGRQLGCISEAACLRHAALAAWPALSCGSCGAYGPVTDAGQRRADQDGLIELAGLALSNRPHVGPPAPGTRKRSR